MKALILNSGVGRRMGALTSNQPKCMTSLITGQTILSRQLTQLFGAGIREVIITTGPFEDALVCHAKDMIALDYLRFVNNPLYDQTNYIYSIYLAKELLDDDLLLLHGDLILEDGLLDMVLAQPKSIMAISTTIPLPEKDFKAVIQQDKIISVGIEFFDNAVAAQPLYLLNRSDWNTWLNSIIDFVDRGERNCYAENALNTVSHQMNLFPYDIADRLCNEVDILEDLNRVNSLIKQVKR